MIVTRLNGGLGNQMFQYAVARSLADRVGGSLRLDVRDLTAYQGPGMVHRFRLGVYPVRATVAGAWGLGARGFFRSRRLRDLAARLGCLRGDLLVERDFSYRPLIVPSGRFTYLEGYWQSWRYFNDDRENIRKDLSLPSETLGNKRSMFERMEKENSVCLHVRLGDYVRSKAVSDTHGNLTAAYYREALKRVRKIGNRLTIYLFSDDPKEAISLLGRGASVRVVEPQVVLPQVDLKLMSACRYLVTANSSFSWWGAWLSQRSGKKVIAPRKWFAGLKNDTKDLIPPDWIRI